LKKKIFKIDELTFDNEIYPRMDIGWQTAYQYSQAMKVGDVFPPIFIGLFEGKYYVVDGWHRVKAKKLLYEQYIDAVVKKYENFADMFLDAVKYNVSHGKQLSTQEKVRIIHKFELMHFKLEQISKIIKVPLDKIELFQARTIMGPNGVPIYLKSVVARAEPNEKAIMEVDMSKLSTRTVAALFEQLIEIIRSGIFSVEDEKTKSLAIELYGLLHEILEVTVEAR
jgi:hypothetical protein